MFKKLLQLIGINCRHTKLSHPFAAAAIARNKSDDWDSVTASSGHYVVCLECGQKFEYDWSNMRVVS